MRASRAFSAAQGILVDTSTKLTLASARALWADGARGLWRYLFFGQVAQREDLDAAELDMLLGLGFWLGAVVHVPLPQPGWQCNGPLGREHALNAMQHAAQAGYVTPTGGRPIALCCDMEGVGTPGAPAVDYVRDGMVLRTAHLYQSLLYGGYASGLTGADLDGFVADASCGGDSVEFWCDAASLAQRPKPSKGYAWHQQMQTTMGGVGVDRDTVLRDGVIWGLVETDVYVEISDEAISPNADPV